MRRLDDSFRDFLFSSPPEVAVQPDREALAEWAKWAKGMLELIAESNLFPESTSNLGLAQTTAKEALSRYPKADDANSIRAPENTEASTHVRLELPPLAQGASDFFDLLIWPFRKLKEVFTK